jgi:hypothetical protein
LLSSSLRTQANSLNVVTMTSSVVRVNVRRSVPTSWMPSRTAPQPPPGRRIAFVQPFPLAGWHARSATSASMGTPPMRRSLPPTTMNARDFSVRRTVETSWTLWSLVKQSHPRKPVFVPPFFPVGRHARSVTSVSVRLRHWRTTWRRYILIV